MLKIDQYEINVVACPYDLSTENQVLDALAFINNDELKDTISNVNRRITD